MWKQTLLLAIHQANGSISEIKRCRSGTTNWMTRKESRLKNIGRNIRMVRWMTKTKVVTRIASYKSKQFNICSGNNFYIQYLVISTNFLERFKMLRRRYINLLVGPVPSWSEDQCPSRGVQFKPWCKSHNFLSLQVLMSYLVLMRGRQQMDNI
jgi:hypothetical protein